MEITINAMRQEFDPEKVRVSLFEKVVPKYRKGCSEAEAMKEYAAVMDNPQEIKLTEFLTLGTRYINTLKKIWEEPDKKKRREMKKLELAAAVISCTVKTRRKDKSLSEKITRYNSVVVLDFDDVFDVEEMKKRVAALPYVYYVGLSASKRGMWAIVPIDNDDYGMHEVFYFALTLEMRKLGLEVDQNCKPVNWLRYVAFDENPIYNAHCEYYSLPDGIEDLYWESLRKSGRPLPTDADDQTPLEKTEYYIDDFDWPERKPEDVLMEAILPDIKAQVSKMDPLAVKIRTYCEEWERKKIVLQDYGEWMRMGMALSTQGEFGWEIFDRISVFSPNYNRDENRKLWERFAKNRERTGIGTFFYKCHQFGVMPYTQHMFDEKQFPVEVFPDEVQRIIGDTHRFLNFDRSFIGSSLLAVASVAVGNSISLEVKREWTDKAIMYMALVGKASSNKSAPLKFAMSALQSRDGREYSKFDKEYDKYDESQRKSGKGNPGPLPEPKFNQTILKDFTPEILIKQHIANPRGLVVYKDELMGFIKDFNKYRNGNDEQIWTELYNGGEMVVNRMNNRPLRIDETFIGIAGTIQPGMLPEFAKGRIESGFIDRWLFAFAEKEGFPEFTDDEIENEVKQSWFRIVDRILSIPLDDKHRIIRMTDEAKKTYKEWFNALARLKNNPKFLLPEMATKMERYCLRFSIVLEALKYGCGQERIDAIQNDSIKGAIDLCTYYLSCAFKVRRLFRRLPVESMSELQKAIYQELPESFSTAEAIKIAVQYGMKERTLKDWLKTDLFIRLYHGQYQRRYSQ